MKKIIYGIALLATTLIIQAQSPKDYGWAIINRLASDSLAGRGYTHNGLERSATFIAEQFKKIGLTPFNGSYYQHFNFPVNAIEECSLEVNGKPLTFGVDYLIGPMSPSGEAETQPETFNASIVDSLFEYSVNSYFVDETERLAGKTIVFPTRDFPVHYTQNGITAKEVYNAAIQSFAQDTSPEASPAIVQLTQYNFIHSIAQAQSNTILFMVKDSAVQKPIKNIKYSVKSTFNPSFETANIVGKIEGRINDKYVFITAHYDHLGQIGNSIFTGANDNASGVAFMLTLAKYFSINKPKYTLVFVAFSGEEAGLVGAEYMVNHPVVPLDKIRFLLNFDILGTGEEGIQVVNSKIFKKEYELLEGLNTKHQLVPEIKSRGEACNSDHCKFYEKGVPCFFTYTLGGNAYYHDIFDRPESLSLAEYDDLVTLFTSFIDEL